jgi:uncharacterized membrane protein YccC
VPENFERTRRLTPCGTLDHAFWLDNNRLAMARFIAAFRSAAPALLFGLRLWASVCLALYIAFWLQLDNAYWAGASAVTVCQPVLGASLRKAWFRLVGTAVGAVAIVFLTACFPQDRVGFLLGLALWGAVCGLVATLLRNFASYGAALAAVTAAVIASDELGAVGGANGDTVLLLAVARASEICIGIICAGVVLAASDLGGARRRLATQLATISAEITGQLAGTFLLVGPEQSKTRRVRRDLIRHVTALDPVIDEALGESSDLRPHSPELQAAVGGLFAALSGWRTAAVHLELLRSDLGRREAVSVLESIPPELRSMPVLGEAAGWTADPSKWCKACASAVRTLTSLPANTPSLRLLADRTAEALIGIRLALNGLLLLVNAAQKIPRSRPAWFSVPDRLPALVNAARIFATIVAVELFWIATAWPGGATAIVFAAIAVIVFSPRADLAYSTAIGFMIGASLAAALTGIVKFAVLPNLTTFVGFCLAIGIVLVPAGMLLAKRQSPMLMAMVVVFLPLLQPANQTSYDTQQFYNSALAIVVGVGAGALSFCLLPPLSPTLLIRRLLTLTLRDLRRLTKGPIRWTAHEWEGRIYGRLSAMPEQAEPLQRAQLLAALSVGTETIRLRRAARRFDREAELDAALDAVARGHSTVAIERLERLDRILAAVPGTKPGGRVRLRARGSILAISEALVQHTSYFGSGAA